MVLENFDCLVSIVICIWQCMLDDCIGILYEELECKVWIVLMLLLVIELLFVDWLEYCFEWCLQDCILFDNKWGFCMLVFELFYNKGELYNLVVVCGMLLEEECFKINEYIIQIFIMFSQLFFLKYLCDVLEIVVCYYEKMDGIGYLCWLVCEQMGLVVWMMVIVDIFEVLIVVDWLYKKGKILIEVLCIMVWMCDENYIDLELFDFFLQVGVWCIYVECFMCLEQIDVVDVGVFACV